MIIRMLASWTLLAVLVLSILYYSSYPKHEHHTPKVTTVDEADAIAIVSITTQKQHHIRRMAKTDKSKKSKSKKSKAKKKKKKNKNIFEDNVCNIEMFEGHWTYLKGCGDNEYNVIIECEEDENAERVKSKHRSRLCKYREETVDDTEYCPYEGHFNAIDALSVDNDDGDCYLELMLELQPDDHYCNHDLQYDILDTKIVAEESMDVEGIELQIYFSGDDRDEYYNQEQPRIALPIEDESSRELHEKIHRELCKTNTDTTCTIDDMNAIIDAHFGDIGAGDRIWPYDPSPDKFNACLELGNMGVRDYESFFHQNIMCMEGVERSDKEENTCKAVRAVFDTFDDLEKKGCRPKFRNYLPAWTSPDMNKVTCKDGSFDITTKTFVEGMENGCNAFATCNTIISVLTLSFNQRLTETCGTTAMLTGLSQAGPVQALRLSTEMVWTGTTTYLLGTPCDYIYELQPGVQNLPNRNSSFTDVCGTNPTPLCSIYYNSFVSDSNAGLPSFPQEPGLEFMFTQSMASSYFQKSTGRCTPEGFQLVKPGLSNFAEVGQYQSTLPDAMRFYCQGMVDDDYDCSYIIPSMVLNKWPGSLPDSAAQYWLTRPGIVGKAADEYAVAYGGGGGAIAKITNKQVLDYFEGLWCSISPDDSLPLPDNFDFFYPNIPRVTEDELYSACQDAGTLEKSVIVFVQSGPLHDKLIPQLCFTGKEPNCKGQITSMFPYCDHWVVLDSCDIENNRYNFISWSRKFTLEKEVLIATTPYNGGLIGGAICNMVVAAPSVDDKYKVDPEPVLCNSDVCNSYCQQKKELGYGT